MSRPAGRVRSLIAHAGAAALLFGAQSASFRSGLRVGEEADASKYRDLRIAQPMRGRSSPSWSYQHLNLADPVDAASLTSREAALKAPGSLSKIENLRI